MLTRQLGSVKIASREFRTGNTDFPGHADGDETEGLVQDPHFRIRQRTANRNSERVRFVGLDFVKGGTNRCLGETVAIEAAQSSGVVQEV